MHKVVPASKDPTTIELVIQTVKELGLQRLTVTRVIEALGQKGVLKAPSSSVVRSILKDRLALRYRSYNSANLRYADEKFDDKRIVVSRLLAQVMKNDCLLISIDEAHFNHIQYQKRAWQPASGGHGVQQMDNRCRVLFADGGPTLGPRPEGQPSALLVQRAAPANARVNMFQVDSASPGTEERRPPRFESSSVEKSAPSSSRLTPMMQRLADLRLSSTPHVQPVVHRLNSSAVKRHLNFGSEVASNFQALAIISEEAGEEDSDVERLAPAPKDYSPEEEMVLLHRRHRESAQQYSFSVTSAISFDKVEATQIVEGGSDSQTFENFLYRLMNSIRLDPKTKDKEVVIFMDNARTHKTEQV